MVRRLLMMFACVGGATLMGSLPAAAGEIRLNFVQPERFVDIGTTPWERERHLKILSEHLKRWESRLPATQVLSIEITDIDLAGEPLRWGTVPELRLLNGRVDSPRIDLRWSLTEGDRTVQSGQAVLRDLGYGSRIRPFGRDGPLPDDRRLLDEWLRATLAQPVIK